MKLILLTIIITQISCVSSFWVSMGGSIIGGVVKDKIIEVVKEKEKEKEKKDELE